MKAKTVFAAVAVVMSVALSGCGSFGTPQPATSYSCVGTTASSSEQLRSAIVTSAARRGWLVSEVAPGTYLCVIDQRNNHVAIEISILEDGKSYSLIPQDYNIPGRKVDQWTSYLQREIAVKVAN